MGPTGRRNECIIHHPSLSRVSIRCVHDRSTKPTIMRNPIARRDRMNQSQSLVGVCTSKNTNQASLSSIVQRVVAPPSLQLENPRGYGHFFSKPNYGSDSCPRKQAFVEHREKQPESTRHAMPCHAKSGAMIPSRQSFVAPPTNNPTPTGLSCSLSFATSASVPL
mmetsp:Transcript_6355/g.18124  ORF Transcript_6355/g.18124 Transcript_6355/m.18124 type:complete len:165 (+) Transcript_6355:14-508(+)